MLSPIHGSHFDIGCLSATQLSFIKYSRNNCCLVALFLEAFIFDGRYWQKLKVTISNWYWPCLTLGLIDDCAITQFRHPVRVLWMCACSVARPVSAPVSVLSTAVFIPDHPGLRLVFMSYCEEGKKCRWYHRQLRGKKDFLQHILFFNFQDSQYRTV